MVIGRGRLLVMLSLALLVLGILFAVVSCGGATTTTTTLAVTTTTVAVQTTCGAHKPPIRLKQHARTHG